MYDSRDVARTWRERGREVNSFSLLTGIATVSTFP